MSGFTFRVGKLNNYIILEDVDFLNSRNGINSYSLQGTLKPFIICGSCLVNSFLLPSIDNRHKENYKKMRTIKKAIFEKKKKSMKMIFQQQNKKKLLKKHGKISRDNNLLKWTMQYTNKHEIYVCEFIHYSTK